jgi:ADP-ribose pyrophosphatase YjhB (NUDIX family)
MKVLPAVEPRELKGLGRQYGAPRRVVVPLERWPMPRGARADRRGEAVFAIQDRSGRVLLHAKGFYPEGVFRLPGGGIHRDEKVADALFREVDEETGLRVQVKTFVAVVEYAVNRRRQPFATYVFLLSTERLQPTVHDPKERISEFKAATVNELKATAEQLRHLPENWRIWGRFRAIPHDLVAEEMERIKAEPRLVRGEKS